MGKNLSNDIELVKDLKKGDIIAFEKLFYRYGSKLLYFAKGYLESEEDAKGIIQDVFMKIWENRENLKENQSFNAYLFTITYNFIRMYYRKKYREEKKIREYHYARKDSFEIFHPSATDGKYPQRFCFGNLEEASARKLTVARYLLSYE